MDLHKSAPQADGHVEIKIKAAVRVAHCMSVEPSGNDFMQKLLRASRDVEGSEEMRQAMALAACAAQKNPYLL